MFQLQFSDFYFTNLSLQSSIYSLTTGLLLIILIHHVLKTLRRHYLLPSGPWGLPFIGCLPFLQDHRYLLFDRWASKYGPVYSLKLGQHDMVVICDWDHMKAAFADEALLARPYEGFFEGLMKDFSFLEMSGDPWKIHRRLSLQILRNIGLGKSTMEESISREIRDRFLPTLGQGNVDFIHKLLPSVSNNICTLLFGQSYDYSDPYKVDLDSSMEKLNQVFHFTNLSTFLPWLARPFALLRLLDYDVLKRHMTQTENLVQRKIDEHQARPQPVNHDEVTNYIDGYLQERRSRRSKSNGIDKVDEIFSDGVLRRNVTEFFDAGSETITSTLSWAIMYLIGYPECQDKIRAEIEQVIGLDREPRYSDRLEMPFTMAFLYEVQRMGSAVASNPLRRATRDTKVGHYTIPRDTLILFNFWSIHRDPKLWPEPEQFDPARFLTADGCEAIKPPYLVPFSGGKRACPGETLANVELFLYLVNIVQRYRIKLPVNTTVSKSLSFEATFGFTRRPANMPLLTFENWSS